jgi:hypothetical protein
VKLADLKTDPRSARCADASKSGAMSPWALRDHVYGLSTCFHVSVVGR